MKLDRVQRRFVLVGVVAFLVMGLVPPWRDSGQRSAGYSVIVAPPEKGYSRIDVSRLILQWILVAAGTAGGAWAVKAFDPKNADQPTTRTAEANANTYAGSQAKATRPADGVSSVVRMMKRLEMGRVTPKTAAEEAILAALMAEGFARRVGNAYERVI